MKVRDVMTSGAISVRPESRLRDLALALIEHQISGVPVVDSEGICVGVISEADLLAKHVSRPRSHRPLDWIFGDRRDSDEIQRRGATTVADAMSTPAVTIAADCSIREAATLMVDRRVNRLPVVSEGDVIGMITRADLVRAYLAMDGEIRQTILDDVLRDTMWLDPDAFGVEVAEGVVRISGTVDRRTTANIIERIIGLVEGVVKVEATALQWELDDSSFEPAATAEREPGASSIVSRERPQPLSR